MIAFASVEERALINHHLSSLIYHHSEAQIRPFVAFVTFCKKLLPLRLCVRLCFWLSNGRPGAHPYRDISKKCPN